MEIQFKVVIPARFESTRFPGKPLQPIDGTPMILHVCERAIESGAEQVIVATDDERIMETVINAGFQAVMTSPDHASGTDRIAEVIATNDWPDSTIIVNIQGDEPLVAPKHIKTMVDALHSQTRADVATVCTPINSKQELFDNNIVKVVSDKNNYALLFSRATIPWDRDSFSISKKTVSKIHYRHLGLYAYRAQFLKRFTSMKVSPLETLEKLEQLRMLWYGESIKVAKVFSEPAIGVDTPDDLLKVEQLIKQRQKKTG
ncbi:MAG: 3-deoxy-manno-octulosonate cytidylyltransferase [Gammaproteobacteria bacterium]|nr:3-deoxy-manno-octulosonate cytidylyltransferase [Gammaproteobacteria bacterium]